jgi:hypothetical protein
MREIGTRPERAFTALALAVGVFHHLPAYTGDTGTWIDLVTPFAVATAAAYGFAGARRGAVALGLAALVLYVDGHGIHLAANAIGHEDAGAAEEETREFWDERWGHIEWHLGWIGLLAALCVADRTRTSALRTGTRATLLAAAVVTGWTLFTSTVEGRDWWLVLGAAPLFVGWTVVRPGRVAALCAIACLVAVTLVGVWAVWQGGVPEFSEVGWL